MCEHINKIYLINTTEENKVYLIDFSTRVARQAKASAETLRPIFPHSDIAEEVQIKHQRPSYGLGFLREVVLEACGRTAQTRAALTTPRLLRGREAMCLPHRETAVPHTAFDDCAADRVGQPRLHGAEPHLTTIAVCGLVLRARRGGTAGQH
jgi:hypothetical protein